MPTLSHFDSDQDRFRLRVVVAAVTVLVCFGLLVWRLFNLQVLRHEELSTRAEANRIAVLPIVPNRGRIVDRNGVVLATNYTAYTLEITPSKVEDLEGTIAGLSTFIDIQARDRKRFKRQLEESKSFESLPIRNRLSDEEVARFIAHRYRFPGVEIKARLFRHYPFGEVGSHLLGYIGRINQAEKLAMEDWDEERQANYRGTEYIGKLGLEQRYEEALHGVTGFEEVETTAGGRAVRRLRSQPPTPGHTLVLSIDIRLQAMVEELFGERRGALVAIDPRNGEVLAFVSKPTFDPNLFVDGIDAENWKELNESIDKPLLNRALRGTYPPGSTYKPFMAMAALNSGKRGPSVIIHDNGSFFFGGHRYGSPENEKGGAMDMRRSIVESSNVYYYTLANEMGVDLIHEQLSPFGFGRRTGIDLEGELTGVLPSTEWKRRVNKRPENKKWYAGETISLGIGQGYNNFTMLQMASALSTLVSGGQRYEPRLVREIESAIDGGRRRVSAAALAPLPLKPEHVAVIRDAMYGVTVAGTSTRVFAGAPYLSGGKTGTAQAVGLKGNAKYSANRMAEHLRDHSLYVAFAPRDEPHIALALIVENAGWGAAAAAPIARRVFDHVLLGLDPSPEDVALTRQGLSAAPVGAQRPASSVPLPRLAGVEPAVPAAPASAAAPRAAPAASAARPARPASSGTTP
ncbi:penicillin-binding protein 2 [Ideonella livida]|uniref:Peptidoglycan D,D-transpeptidase MrdA n=1 Tax=Ideonella livida TaxID=2707176 RepID=A0A7C9PG50_9BURK|nr:penicillin-binding protein 2 [Ideonella livida]NDY91035.1 penicillin-binding protein 2 [Ideonella livida]